MYRHIVLFWLKDPSEENLRAAREKLASLQGKIEGLLSVEVEPDALHSERSCHLCLNMVFASRSALDAYRTHPAHLPVQKHMHAVRSMSSAADYEITRPARRMPRLYGLLGPASADPETLLRLFDAGLDGACLCPGGSDPSQCLSFADALHGAAARAGVRPELLVDVSGLPVPAELSALGATGALVALPDEGDPEAVRALLPKGVRLLAKVVSPAGLARLPSLVQGADELAVARDAMARRMPLEQIPQAQKRAVSAALSAGKPCMVSGGILASLRRQKEPSAAELLDIHTAVCDGTSSLLLRQTADGPDPALAVETLRKVAEAAAAL